jgi:hypothetical protein
MARKINQPQKPISKETIRELWDTLDAASSYVLVDDSHEASVLFSRVRTLLNGTRQAAGIAIVHHQKVKGVRGRG